MADPDRYTTVRHAGQALLRERGSRFCARAVGVSVEEDVRRALAAARREHARATHHCYACRFAALPGNGRASDAREPRGSAGPPIRSAIEAAGITDVLVIVSRYYGGRKLGLPALSKAYREAAAAALAHAGTEARYLQTRLEAVLPYEMLDGFLKTLHRHEANVLSSNLDAECRYRIEVRKGRTDKLLEALESCQTGKGKIRIIRG